MLLHSFSKNKNRIDTVLEDRFIFKSVIKTLLLSSLLFVSFSVAASDADFDDSFFGADQLDINEFIGSDPKALELEERVKTLERQLLRAAEIVCLVRKAAVEHRKEILRARRERIQLRADAQRLKGQADQQDSVLGTHLRQIVRNRDLSTENEILIAEIVVRLSPEEKAIV